MLFVGLLGGCYSTPPDPPAIAADPTVTVSILEPVYTAGKAIDASREVGVTYPDFHRFLLQFAQAISIAADRAEMNATDRRVLAQYKEAAADFTFIDSLWAMKVRSVQPAWRGQIPVAFDGVYARETPEDMLRKHGLVAQEFRLQYTGRRFLAVPPDSVERAWLKAGSDMKIAHDMYLGRAK